MDMAIGTAMSYEEKKYFSDPSAESCFHSVQISRNEKELKRRGLCVSGVKQELIDRLTESINQENDIIRCVCQYLHDDGYMI